MQVQDLGQIANINGASFRSHNNLIAQAQETKHSGPTEPPVIYPNMLWFDSGTGQVKLRNPTNTSWATIGTIGPPFKWTAFDFPDTAFTTGDVKLTFKTVADSGWVMMNDGTIGDGSSGASTRANADTSALFSLLWANTADAPWCTMYAAGGSTPTGRGASAAADFAAHRHMALPKVLGRALASAGWGSGLSNLTLATWQGVETVALTAAQLAAHTHSVTVPAHTHAVQEYAGTGSTGQHISATTTGSASGTSTGSGGGASLTSGSAGSGDAHTNIQPTTYLNVMIKL